MTGRWVLYIALWDLRSYFGGFRVYSKPISSTIYQVSTPFN